MNAEIITKLCREQAYNTQLHGITSKQFVDKIHLPFKEESKKSLKNFKKQLIEEGVDEKEIKHGMDALMPRLFRDEVSGLAGSEVNDYKTYPEDYGRIDSVFEKLYCITQLKHFHVPEHVVLPEDACHTETTEFTATVSRNRALYNEILEEKQLSVHLDDRITKLKEAKSNIKIARDTLKVLESLVE